MSEVTAATIFMEEDENEAGAFDGMSLVALPVVDHAGVGEGLALAFWFEMPGLFDPLAHLPFDAGAGWDRRWRSPWPPPSAERRHILLQVFLF